MTLHPTPPQTTSLGVGRGAQLSWTLSDLDIGSAPTATSNFDKHCRADGSYWTYPAFPWLMLGKQSFQHQEKRSSTIFTFFYARLSISQGITYSVPPNWKSHFQSRVLDRRANFTRQIEKIDWIEILLSKYYFQTKRQVPVESRKKSVQKIQTLLTAWQALSDVKVIKYRLDRTKAAIFRSIETNKLVMPAPGTQLCRNLS